MAAAEALLPLDLPPSSAGAPLPHVFADEERLLIAYIVNVPDPSFDGTNPRSVSAVAEGEAVAILTVAPYVALQFGPPNDEALSGHRLYALGLQPYSAFEVLNSSWIASLEEANRVHPRHVPELFSGRRHFILTFHDSTLEFIARDFQVGLRKGAVLKALLEAVNY
ncbi:hypothetical protein EN828_15680 [Mesorhizobium sp. M2D.F.Ca.ET.185.01.1.1]|uniref:hypothetical protein n=3 Tax=Mesorhizobium TaxID=68287 RepID=UPI000FCC9188|nr:MULTISPECIES: hypothetical protein [unclassified Mesorhizobium]TGP49285.1 hypothetical protein EN873_30900 [bacterium M00.F.Ca.ET.230.01.1.1]TGP80377.1 hypothetical protein EN870_12000 [bacterium M00.F.Ca.ET.227.01.1.1]TGQ00654.1 hypothetical protein EN864_01340 [bacterium M00.F.Ca.ET.221.01.1.1]TGQ02825.1 hypothetical protein EN865_02565 [bacterium M00.F.Ca.ET.222.01.1.1]TGT74498.1 hypothetical protein EN802_11660 [bacterium M00.F.Ca.ET.159.01.1.1]TGT86748.1 hypothetical protein EN800_085